MSSSYVVKYTMNGDSQRPLRWKTHRPQSNRSGVYHDDIYTLALSEEKRKINHPKKPRISHTKK